MHDSRNKTRQTLTAEEAATRIEEIRRVYDKRFLTRGELESLKRNINARVERTRPSRAA